MTDSIDQKNLYDTGLSQEETISRVEAQQSIKASSFSSGASRRICRKLVSVEGLDGSGKTTLIQGLTTYLRDQGITVRNVVMLAPGPIREAVLLDQSLTPEQRLMLLMVAAETARRDILEALGDGDFVLLDRGYDSFIAYQGYGDNLEDLIIKVKQAGIFPDHPFPDLTFYLQAPVAVCLERVRARLKAQAGDAPVEVFESRNEAFYERVAQGFEDQVNDDTDRFHVLDATSKPGLVLLNATARLSWLLESTDG